MKSGLPVSESASLVGLSRRTPYEWKKLFEAETPRAPARMGSEEE